MWHASISGGVAPRLSYGARVPPETQAAIERDRTMIARRVLEDLGDATAGEWTETGSLGIVHLRRRLRADEAELVGPVVDVRNTDEGARRFAAMQPYLPPGWREAL